MRTETRLAEIAAAVAGGTLPGADKIGERLGRAWRNDKMRKHFTVTITDKTFTHCRDVPAIATAWAMDGIYVIRTSIEQSEEWTPATVVRTYKRLSLVERVFRNMKTTQLLVRPIFHREADRVRGHIFLCMLAAHVALELERRLADLLFVDVGLASARDTREPVSPSKPSEEGKRKKRQQVTVDGESPLHSLRTLFDAMGSQARVTLRVTAGATFDQVATPTKWQANVFAAAKRTPA